MLAGARPSVLALVPDEADRFTFFLPLFIVTAAVSGLSMIFAVATAILHGNLWGWFAAVPIGIGWAIVIFVIDRALTASMRSTKSLWRMTLTIVPRVCLALVIGVVVSEPLVLQVLDNDIQAQMAKDSQVRLAELRDGLEPLQDARDEAQKQLSALQVQAQTGTIVGAEATDSPATTDARDAVARLTAEVEAQRKVVAEAEALYACATDDNAPWIDGCVRRATDSWQFFFDKRATAQADVEALQSQLKSAQTMLSALEQEDATRGSADATANRDAAKLAIPDAQTRLDSAQAALDTANQEITQITDSAKGLLSRMESLENLAKDHSSVRFAHIFLFLLFLFIELMPVIVKAFRSWGDPNPYELAETAAAEAAREQRAHEVAEQRGELEHTRLLRAGELESERSEAEQHRTARVAATMAVEQDMLNREVELGRRQNERVASRMETVVTAALEEWENQVDRTFRGEARSMWSDQPESSRGVDEYGGQSEVPQRSGWDWGDFRMGRRD